MFQTEFGPCLQAVYFKTGQGTVHFRSILEGLEILESGEVACWWRLNQECCYLSKFIVRPIVDLYFVSPRVLCT